MMPHGKKISNSRAKIFVKFWYVYFEDVFYENKPENPFQTVTSQKFVDILLIYCFYSSYIAYILTIYADLMLTLRNYDTIGSGYYNSWRTHTNPDELLSAV